MAFFGPNNKLLIGDDGMITLDYIHGI